MAKKTFDVQVKGFVWDEYQIEAEDHDEAERIATGRFKDERQRHGMSFDDVEAEAERLYDDLEEEDADSFDDEGED